MQIITVTNQKGGVGKTTTAHVLSTGLIKRGFSVLSVDTDPQTNFTYTTGITPKTEEINLYDLFKGNATPLQAIKHTNIGFDVIPGSLNLAGADMEFTRAGREYILKEILEPLSKSYNFCIIDTPPTLGILTINALVASEKVIVPMNADIYSIQGLSQLQSTIENVKKYCNPNLVIEGLLITKYDHRAIINRRLKESLNNIAKKLNTKVFSSCIRQAVAIKETQFLQSDIFKEYPNSNVTKDYQSFIDEFLNGEI